MKRLFVMCCGALVVASAVASVAPAWEKQLTFGTDKNHSLDNNLNFSPDSQWLAYDTRAFSGGIGNTTTLEKVNIDTGDIVIIHETEDQVMGLGPGVAAVSYFPTEDKVIAIHGLPSSTGLKYEGFRRFGAMFSPTDGTADIVIADARDVTTPFTAGALRGGTHRHEPSGDGQWIGFTYNDMIMRGLGKDLRTIGVTKLGIPVDVDEDSAGENFDGTGFTVLVVKVKPEGEVTPDSEEIFQASEDSWVGDYGYDLGDGTMQRARAFIGKTKRNVNGSVVTRQEVFIVDIPEDITVPGSDGPLEGTDTTFPMPPEGTVQRMLTYSDSNCNGIIRCSKDGSQIAFTRADGNGVNQVHLISPLGGEPVQATFFDSSANKPWWHPSGDYLFSSSGGSIWGTNVIPGDPAFGTSWMITEPTPSAAPDNLVVSPDGNWIAFCRKIDNVNQIFVAPAAIPEPSMFLLGALGLLALASVRRRG